LFVILRTLREALVPPVEVVFWRDVDGTVPLLEWIEELPPKAQDKCVAALKRLGALGHELRRPIVDYLRDDIYELRVGLRRNNYRMLYFFHGRTAAVVSHGLEKERIVPPKEIDKAIRRKRAFEVDPPFHTFIPEGMP